MIQAKPPQSGEDVDHAPGSMTVDHRGGQGGRKGCSPPDSPLIDVSGVAALLPCSAKHVRRMADTGRRTTTKTDYGVFDPDKFWGHVLSGPAATTDQPDAFDARVERALRFMRNMFFTPEEHTSASEAMVRVLTGDYKIEGKQHE